VRNADLPNPFSASHLFDGLAPDANSILIKFTYVGDADLSGTISIDDYLQIDDAFLTHKSATWINGDFNDDGLIDFHDYALIDYASSAQMSPLADAEIANHTAEFGDAYTQALFTLGVPEPASLAILFAAFFSLLARRKRGRIHHTMFEPTTHFHPVPTHGIPFSSLNHPHAPLNYGAQLPVLMLNMAGCGKTCISNREKKNFLRVKPEAPSSTSASPPNHRNRPLMANFQIAQRLLLRQSSTHDIRAFIAADLMQITQRKILF